MTQRGIAAASQSTRPLFVERPDPPSLGAGQALCRTLELGVCGTDREILASGHPLTPDGDSYLVLGHECLARVEAVGEGVDSLTEGQLVVPTVRRRLANEPRAVRPRANPQASADPDAHASRLTGGSEDSIRIDLLNFGDYTERGIVRQHGFSVPRWVDDAEYLYPVDQTFAPVAVLTEPQAVAEKAINEALLIQRVRLGDQIWQSEPPRVAVTGMGPIGFAAVIGCIARSWQVTMIGRDARDTYRARLAERFGATYAVAARLELSPDRIDADGFDLLLECTGNDAVMLQAAGALAARGVGVWLGASRVPQAARHNVDQLMRSAIVRNHVFLGVVNAAPRDFHDAMQNLAVLQQSHADELADLITARVRPDGALVHFEQRMPQGIKTVVMYQ